MSTIADRLRALQALPAVAPGSRDPSSEVPSATPLEDHPKVSGIPRPRQQRPARPAQLKGPARSIWDEVVAELEHLGILDRLDRGALLRYCTLRVEWDELTAKLRAPARPAATSTAEAEVAKPDDPYFVTYSSGAQQLSGAFVARKQVASELASLESELGLTPASRSRLLFAAYGGRPLATPKDPNQPAKRGLRGAYRKRGTSA